MKESSPSAKFKPSKFQQQSQYQKSGFISPLQILTREETKKLHTQFISWQKSLPEQKVSGNLRFKPHLYLPFINRLVHHPTIVETVSSILDTTNILLWSSDFNIKEAHTDGFYALHQDGTYTGLKPSELGVTVWLAITDPVDELHGCMTYIEESHIFGQLPHMEATANDGEDGNQITAGIGGNNNNMLSRGQKVILSEDEQAQLKWKPVLASLRGGEASLHHFHLLHKSGPNKGNQPRIGLALRYISGTVRQTGSTREMVTLVKGKMEHNGFDLEPILPLNEEDVLNIHMDVGRKVHKEAMERESMNYFDSSENQNYL